MIVTKTPFRISLFGGGTDYPAWYKKHGGMVISMAIPYHCYVMIRPMPDFSHCRYRISYTTIEETDSLNDIKHPTVRETLRAMNVDSLQVYHDSDLPARRGLGTSSAFTVGLIAAISQAQGRTSNIWHHDSDVLMNLAKMAIHIEREKVWDTVGDQDQLATTLGGLRHYEWLPDDWLSDGAVKVTNLITPDSSYIRKMALNDMIKHLALYPTTQTRSGTGSQVAKTYTFDPDIMARIHDLAREGLAAISQPQPDPKAIGQLISQTWFAKRNLSPSVTSDKIDGAYMRAMEAGAYGGRLIGAGGGGYMLLVAPPDRHETIGQAVGSQPVPVRLEKKGCRVILDDWG